MCGIAGIISKSKVERSVVKKMTDTIAHRGPDGEGFWFNDNNTLGLGHRRLSIIDLSDNGKQPMHYLEGRYTIIFNGEIYNYIELREDLISKGYHFKSGSDTEVLLALYDFKKEKCLDDLDGMFAFAIWDNKTEQLFCARDRFGEKPFYYSYLQNEFIFCSEIKGLLAVGVSKELNPPLLYSFIETSHVLHNPNAPEETFYKHINRLPKAHYMLVDAKLSIEVKRYWSLDSIKVNNEITFENAKTKFLELFTQSIARRLRSDVPVGSSLSGGLDSSSIVSLISKLDVKVQHTFSARFANFKRDEGKYIDIATQHLKVNKHFVWPDENSFLEEFQNMLWHQDEPIGSASIYAQYCVMKKAKEEGVTVLLDGQGADEILAGYEYYLDFYLQSVYHQHPENYQAELSTIQQLHSHLNFEDQTLKSIETPKLRKKPFINPLLMLTKPKIYKRIKNNWPLAGFYSSDFIDSVTDKFKVEYKGEYNINQYLKHSLMTDNLEDLLRYSDRNSMAHHREVRLPFLSHNLVEFLFSLPEEMKIYKGWTKYILRSAMADLMPNEITWRVDKVGYEPPQTNWMKHAKINDMVNEAFSKLQKNSVLSKTASLTESNIWPILATLQLQ